jgi:hypothetical protein
MLTLNGTSPFIRIERSGVPTWQIQNNYLSVQNGFSVNNITAGTTPFFIGENGNVGIGTTSPSAALQIFRSAFSGNQFKTYAELSAAPTVLSYTTSDGFGLILNMYEAISGVPYTRYADIVANTGDVSDSVMRFFTKPYSGNAAERMRITSGGNVGIGLTNPSYKLHIVGSTDVINATSTTTDARINIGHSGNGGYVGYANLGAGNASNTFYVTTGSGVIGSGITMNAAGSVGIGTSSPAATLDVRGAATFSSSVTATSFFESSDKRLKSNIIDLDVNVSSIIAKSYLKNGVEEIGYIAQDVKNILPSAISIRENGYLDLSYRQIHTAKIAALEKEVAELKKQLNK